MNARQRRRARRSAWKEREQLTDAIGQYASRNDMRSGDHPQYGRLQDRRAAVARKLKQATPRGSRK